MKFYREPTYEELNKILLTNGVVYVLTSATNNHGLPDRHLFAIKPTEVHAIDMCADKRTGRPALVLREKRYEEYTIYPTLEDVNEKIKSISRYWFYNDDGQVIGWNLPYNRYREALRKLDLMSYIYEEAKNPNPQRYWRTILTEGHDLIKDLTDVDARLFIDLLDEYEERARDAYEDYDYSKEDTLPHNLVCPADLWKCADAIKKYLLKAQNIFGYTTIARAVISFPIVHRSMAYAFRSQGLTPSQEDSTKIRIDMLTKTLWRELHNTNEITDRIADLYTESVFQIMMYFHFKDFLKSNDTLEQVIRMATDNIDVFIGSVVSEEFGMDDPRSPETARYISAVKQLYPNFASVSSGDIKQLFPFDTKVLKKAVSNSH